MNLVRLSLSLLEKCYPGIKDIVSFITEKNINIDNLICALVEEANIIPRRDEQILCLKTSPR